MNDVPIETFQRAVLATYGAQADPVEKVRVDERFGSEWPCSGSAR